MSTPSNKKVDTAIVVAIIGLFGTLCVGILNSPLLAKLLLERATPTQTVGPGTPSATIELTTMPAPTVTTLIDTATPSPSATTIADTATLTPAIADATETSAPGTTPPVLQQVFKADFENNFASGFGFTLGDWKIIRDKSNHVLQGDSVGSVAPGGIAYFGPSDFSDGAVEFRVKFPDSTSKLYFEFRQDDANGSYALLMDPNNKVVALGTYKQVNQNMQFTGLSSGSQQSFTFQKDTWYKIRLDAKGENLAVSIDGNRILSASDSQLTHGRLRFTLDPNSTIDFDDTYVWAYTP